jgi:superoxide dismutase, Fe-Mn family
MPDPCRRRRRLPSGIFIPDKRLLRYHFYHFQVIPSRASGRIYEVGASFHAAESALATDLHFKRVRKVEASTIMFYKLPELPYAEDALEPYIDSETMRIHYGKHHSTYVENLNEALSDYPQLQAVPLEALLSKPDAIPPNVRMAIRNNGGGHYNHSLFWKTMKKDGGGSPYGDLADAIRDAFGSYAEFKSRFSQSALRFFGAGWTWLYFRDSKLHLDSMLNQDNPLAIGGEPILGLDLWEHAYYLRYRSRRADYLEAWWNVVNWEQVAGNWLDAQKGARIFGFPVRGEQSEAHAVHPRSRAA